MLDSIEHIGLDCRVMVHIHQCQFVARFERLPETPVADVISAQTGIAPETVDVFGLLHRGLIRQCLLYLRLIWHLKTVGHMACERCIDDGGLDSGILHDVEHRCLQITRLPRERAPGLNDDLQPRMTLLQPLYDLHEMVEIISFASDEMPTPHIEPFHLIEIWAELLFE